MTSRRGLALVVLGALCWGAGGLSGALLGGEASLGAGAVAAYRLLGGGIAVLVGVALVEAVRPRGRLRVASRAAWGRVAAVAALIAVFQATYFQAVYLVGVAVATLVTLGSAPVIVAGAQAVRRRRLPAAHVLVAIACAVVGLVLLVVVDQQREDTEPGTAVGQGASAVGPISLDATVLAGVGLALAAALAFATLVVVNRRPVAGMGPLVMTGVSFTVGGVLLVPFAAFVGGFGVPSTGLGWWWLAFLALVPTALAYALYFTGLPAAGATPAALAALLEPLAAALLAVVVLGERLGPAGWCGAMLLVIAVVLARPRPGGSPTMVLGPRAARGHNHAPARAGDEPWE
ncbi:MAG: EamA family transporter [Actinomycetales bacterium]|nr:EamA family transporter [Actinomycetales bacterium]